MDKFLGHVVDTITQNSKRRLQHEEERQHTLPVLDDVGAIEASRKASAPAASNDREHSSSAGHWLERKEFNTLSASVQEFAKKAEGHVANG